METKQTEKKRMGRPPTSGPRRNVTMSWPIEFTQLVDEAAEKAGKTRTELVIELIERSLRNGAR